MPDPVPENYNYPMNETETVPPQVYDKEWEGFVRELRLARPWMMAMAIIDIIIGVLYLPFGAGSILAGVILIMAESRLRRFLEGEAKALSAFAGHLKLYFIISVIAVIAAMVLYFLFIFLYVGLILLAIILIALSRATGAH